MTKEELILKLKNSGLRICGKTNMYGSKVELKNYYEAYKPVSAFDKDRFHFTLTINNITIRQVYVIFIYSNIIFIEGSAPYIDDPIQISISLDAIESVRVI